MHVIERVRTAKELFGVLGRQQASMDMLGYVFELPPEMSAEEAWTTCTDPAAMVSTAGVVGVERSVLLEIGMDVASRVLFAAPRECIYMLRAAGDVVAGHILPEAGSRKVEHWAGQVRGREADLDRSTKCAASAVYAAATAVVAPGDAKSGNDVADLVGLAVTRAAEVLAEDAPGDVLGIVRKRMPWAVMEAALEGLWGQPQTEVAGHGGYEG